MLTAAFIPLWHRARPSNSRVIAFLLSALGVAICNAAGIVMSSIALGDTDGHLVTAVAMGFLGIPISATIGLTTLGSIRPPISSNQRLAGWFILVTVATILVDFAFMPFYNFESYVFAFLFLVTVAYVVYRWRGGRAAVFFLATFWPLLSIVEDMSKVGIGGLYHAQGSQTGEALK